MYFSDTCKLIKTEEEKNSYGANIISEKVNEVFCNKKSIGQNESYQLSKLGFKGELKVEVWTVEYNDEELLEFNNKKYKIQRVYHRDDEKTELTCIKAIL